jgi:hypothetical protein
VAKAVAEMALSLPERLVLACQVIATGAEGFAANRLPAVSSRAPRRPALFSSEPVPRTRQYVSGSLLRGQQLNQLVLGGDREPEAPRSTRAPCSNSLDANCFERHLWLRTSPEARTRGV